MVQKQENVSTVGYFKHWRTSSIGTGFRLLSQALGRYLAASQADAAPKEFVPMPTTAFLMIVAAVLGCLSTIAPQDAGATNWAGTFSRTFDFAHNYGYYLPGCTVGSPPCSTHDRVVYTTTGDGVFHYEVEISR